MRLPLSTPCCQALLRFKKITPETHPWVFLEFHHLSRVDLQPVWHCDSGVSMRHLHSSPRATLRQRTGIFEVLLLVDNVEQRVVFDATHRVLCNNNLQVPLASSRGSRIRGNAHAAKYYAVLFPDARSIRQLRVQRLMSD
jgi:hypothetical protein